MRLDKIKAKLNEVLINKGKTSDQKTKKKGDFIMARNTKKEKMVTRTFVETEAVFMVIDLGNDNAIEDRAEVFAGCLNETEVFEVGRKQIETDTVKVLKVKTVNNREVLRGMVESVFLANSVVLPPRTKTEDTEDTEDTEQ